MKIGKREFVGGTFVMAIVNLTPDSFYSGSRVSADGALFAVERAVAAGAAIVDIGAQSTRPGYTEISADEEIGRFYSPLLKIKQNFDIPVSVDTYFSKSAEAALSAGADMINDVWGLSHDGDMAKVVAAHGASVCIMHNSKTPTKNLWTDVPDFLKRQTEAALAAGIERDKICIDGGIGFAKTKEQNFELLNGYERLAALGYPTLLGCSRKSMFGGRPEDRLPQTLAATIEACKKGVLFVRVHDVDENVRIIRDFNNGLDVRNTEDWLNG